MRKKFYLTTAIPYVNASPHLGFALEVVQADVIARYQRSLDNDVYFLAGTDENALKNVQAAKKEGINTQQLVDRNSQKFYELKKALNLTYDDFIRTTEKRHLKGSQALWQACKKEDIYKKQYQGLYCVGCEAYYTKKDLIDGKCPEHKKEPDMVEEENYFFRLSKYQDWLEDLISTDKLKIIPQTRKNEVLAFIHRGLEDFSISRTIKRAHSWGIPVPGDPKQIIYVWFDALANYITALGWHNKDKLFQKYWPADLHIIGKGITRFHAIYWPAMLKSAGIPLPKKEFVHGYITIEGEKISKSLGNVINPFELVKKYGVDAIRYYLLREIPAYGDGDFSISRFKELYNADLANGLGNLVARVAKLCETKNCSPQISFPTTISDELENHRYHTHLECYEFNLALEAIWRIIKDTDVLIDTEKPWTKSDIEVKNCLSNAVQNILDIAYALQPFLPKTAKRIKKQLTGSKIKSAEPLFPRIK